MLPLEERMPMPQGEGSVLIKDSDVKIALVLTVEVSFYTMNYAAINNYILFIN